MSSRPPEAEIILDGETVSPARPRSIATTCLAAVLLVALCNLPAWWYLRNYTWQYHIPPAKWAMLTALDQRVDTLILGDSSAMMGVVPSLVDQGLGGTSINLARRAAPPALEDAWMLDRYIERWGPPRTVIAVYAYNSLDQTLSPRDLVSIPLSLTQFERMEPAPALTSMEEAEVLLRRGLPIYYAAGSLSNAVLTPWNALRELDRVTLQPDGYLSASADPAAVDEMSARCLEQLQGAVSWQVSEINRHGLQRILQLAETHHFDVFVANGPVHDRLDRDPRFDAAFRTLRADLDRLVAASPRAHYVLRDRMAFPASQMQNSVHLTRASSPLYTARLVEEIRRVLSPH